MAESVILQTGRDVDLAVGQIRQSLAEFSVMAQNLCHHLSNLSDLAAALDRHTEALNRVAYLESQAKYGGVHIGHPAMGDLITPQSLAWNTATPAQIIADMNKMLGRMTKGGK